MNTTRDKGSISAEEVLQRQDARRLIQEGIERLGERAEGLTRRELIMLIRQVITLGVEALEKRERTKSFGEAGWESIAARGHCRAATLRDLRYCLRRMLQVEGAGEQPLRAMSTGDCRQILQAAFGHSPSLYIKGRAAMSSIFSYGIKHELCDSNPVRRIEVPKVQEQEKEPLGLPEVERLKAAAALPEHRAMRFSLHLMLYSGVRPTEVSRLQERDINWEMQQVRIRSACSKTGGGRMVPLRGMRGWRREDCIIPRNWHRRWQALRRAAGFARGSWQPDVCRHTFASYHAARYRDLPALQMEMGHRDLTLLRTRYVSPIGQKESRQFFSSAP